jgi:hypothetical protein
VNYNLRWDLLQPVDVGAAVQTGFERGVTRSAMADLATDPTNQGALSRLAMFQPEAAMQMRDRGRQETFRNEMRSAFDVTTGEIDPARARAAFVNAGDIPGAMEFDRSRATTARADRQANEASQERLARLAEGATPENWAQTRTAAIELGVPAANIPEAYDEGWLQRQRTILRAFLDPNERTAFARDLETAGYDLSTTEGEAAARRFLEQRYAAPPRIIMVNGVPTLVQGEGGATGAPPPELTDEDISRMEQGGPAPANGPATFP